MSPNDLEVLIYYHYSPIPHPRRDAPAVQQAINRFLNDGIFGFGTSTDSGYCLTAKGEAFLELILSTPMPVMKWIDPRTESR